MNSIFKKWTNGSVLVTDAGWGDSGKGKVVSTLIPDIACKIIGGHNAGHTVVTDKGELGLGLIPSSVIHPKVINIIGQEVVINPSFLIEEIGKINKFGIKLTPKNFIFDIRCHLVMPWHEIRDALSEEARGKFAVGSLHLGVGWTYSDRINRRGLRFIDIFGSDWKKKLREEFENQKLVIKDMKKDTKRKTGVTSKIDTNLSFAKISKDIFIARKKLKKYSSFTTKIVWDAIDDNKKILFEDSHGAMLDVAHGSWPYTTGVNTGLAAVYRSFGGKAVRSIGKIVVCSKAYQTRVGGGPMPTEDFGKLGETLRENGHEFGTRSGRPRRCGPFDLPLLKYGLEVLGLGSNDEIALTKLDVLTKIRKIPVCVKYDNEKQATNTDARYLEKVKILYKNFPGWEGDVTKVKNFNNLPINAKNYIVFLEKELGRKITFIGTGQHKDAKIIR